MVINVLSSILPSTGTVTPADPGIVTRPFVPGRRQLNE